MSRKIGPVLIGILVLLGAQACIFGGGDDGDGNGSTSRPNAIPTATLPATMTDPILLGASSSSGGGSTGGGTTQTTSYVVQDGDTLGAIATAQGVPADQQASWIQEVARLNNLADPRFLNVGVELILPVFQAEPTATPGVESTQAPNTAAPTATTAAAQPTATTAASGGGGTYTVESGDYPILIAGKLGVPEAEQAAWADELVAINGIDPSNLSVGQVLELPANTPQ